MASLDFSIAHEPNCGAAPFTMLSSPVRLHDESILGSPMSRSGSLFCVSPLSSTHGSPRNAASVTSPPHSPIRSPRASSRLLKTEIVESPQRREPSISLRGLPHKIQVLTRTQHTLQALLQNAHRDIATLLKAQDEFVRQQQNDQATIRNLQRRLRMKSAERPKPASAEGITTQASTGPLLAAQQQVARYKKEAEAWKSRFLQLEAQRRAMHNTLQELQGNIRVFCRVRPVRTGARTVVKAITSGDKLEQKIVVHHPKTRRDRSFELDRVFQHSDSQDTVFAQARPVVQSVLDGYNACIFAYGQTGSGKTHTMFGTEESPGVAPRTVAFMLETLQSIESSSSSVAITCLEVYKDEVFDLLAPAPRARLEVTRCGAHGEPWAEGAASVHVQDADAALELMQAAARARRVGSHELNHRSSRSHCIVSLAVRRENESGELQVVSRLNMVDLAGSERLDRTKAAGEQMKEGVTINSSLSCLGRVMSALRSRQKGSTKTKQHIPFRDSKLTRLLQGSLST